MLNLRVKSFREVFSGTVSVHIFCDPDISAMLVDQGQPEKKSVSFIPICSMNAVY